MTADAISALSSRLDIADLIAKYAVHLDAGEFDPLEALFTENAIFDITPDPGIVPVPVQGRRRIREVLEERYRVVSQQAQRRHVMSNTVIDEFSGGHAQSRTFLTVLSIPKGGGGPELHGTGVYNDRFELVDGRWLFAERRLEVDALGT